MRLGPTELIILVVGLILIALFLRFFFGLFRNKNVNRNVITINNELKTTTAPSMGVMSAPPTNPAPAFASAANYCGQCGNNLSSEVKYCPGCGAKKTA
jgi:hypothetical protein